MATFLCLGWEKAFLDQGLPMPSSKAKWPHPEGCMALSADHSTEWAQTCTGVLVTGLGFYNITGNKDIQPHPAHKKGPVLSHGCVGLMLSSTGRRQSQCLFCTPTPKCTTCSCCWWMGKNRKREREKWVEGDRKRGRETLRGRVSMNECC